LQTPLGIGPGNSAGQRLSLGHRERKHSYLSKEAHNDYVGYLVERGPLGLLSLLILVVQPFVALWWVLKKNTDRRWKAGVGGALAAALVGGLVATTIHSFVIEKLHFRHFWMFLAIVFAFRAAGPPRPARAGARAPDEGHPRRAPRGSVGIPRSCHEVRQSNGVHPESV
jgi:O-antigen ligase